MDVSGTSYNKQFGRVGVSLVWKVQSIMQHNSGECFNSPHGHLDAGQVCKKRSSLQLTALILVIFDRVHFLSGQVLNALFVFEKYIHIDICSY